ncbi:methyl-accepting chemotaxis protein [Paenibacillus sp.]|uniref:methyl-accepting chemotaxis protein n=1 Tax=Paenibacillus sp. TaxID=58172 RepID=UPI002D5F29F5|nr:methyl-accepting chemotaxis protein [Paenibacillus sp.]HZG57238.1 methyl-accepting chemotaxis protein [Paenibacillus sp.]
MKAQFSRIRLFKTRGRQPSVTNASPPALESTDTLKSVEAKLKQIKFETSDFLDSMSASAEELTAFTNSTKESSTQIAENVDALAKSQEMQHISVLEASKAVSELSLGIQSIADSTSIVAETSSETYDIANQGNSFIQRTIDQMKAIDLTVNTLTPKVVNLGEQSKKIDNIIGVITQIATQTNLLSLNASIEAARAGEHGRGFAVVASEVKKLAEQSKRSAIEIQSVIKDIQSETKEVVSLMEVSVREVSEGMKVVAEAGAAFTKIVEATQLVSNQILDVSAITQQMSASSEEISATAENMVFVATQAKERTNKVAEEIKGQLLSIEDIAAFAESMAHMTSQMQELLKKYN